MAERINTDELTDTERDAMRYRLLRDAVLSIDHEHPDYSVGMNGYIGIAVPYMHVCPQTLDALCDGLIPVPDDSGDDE